MLACTKIECEVIEENTEIIKRALNREFGIDFSKQEEDGTTVFTLIEFFIFSTYYAQISINALLDSKGYNIEINGRKRENSLYILLGGVFGVIFFYFAYIAFFKKPGQDSELMMIIILLLEFIMGALILGADYLAFNLYKSFVCKKVQRKLDQLSAELCQTNNNKQNCSTTETDVAAYYRFCGAELKQNAAFCSKCGKQTK